MSAAYIMSNDFLVENLPPEKSSQPPSMSVTSSVFEQNPEYLQNMERVKSLKTEISLVEANTWRYEEQILDLKVKCRSQIKTLRKQPKVHTDTDKQKESVEKLHQAKVNLVFAEKEYRELMKRKRNLVDLQNMHLQTAREIWAKILSELDIDFDWSNARDDDSDGIEKYDGPIW